MHIKRSQQGATLIEALVTMLVVAIGLLGVAALLLASTRFQQTSTFRTEAIQQMDFIVEKMRVNNTVLSTASLAAAQANPEGAYLAADAYGDAASLPANPGCGLSLQPACTAAQAAQRDLREWRESLDQALPGGRGAIFPVVAGGATEPNARRVVVMWREKSEVETDTDANLGIADREDDSCPAPRVNGIRCLNFWVTP